MPARGAGMGSFSLQTKITKKQKRRVIRYLGDFQWNHYMLLGSWRSPFGVLSLINKILRFQEQNEMESQG